MRYLWLLFLTGCLAVLAQPFPLPPSEPYVLETDQIMLEWNPSLSTGVLGYQVASNNVPSNYVVFVKTVGTNITLVPAGGSNYFVVRCSNSVLFSIWSEPILYYAASPKPATNAYVFMVLVSIDGLTWTTNTVLNRFTNPTGLPGMKLWRFEERHTNLNL